MGTVIHTAKKTYDYGDRFSDPNRGRDRRKVAPGEKKRGYQVSEMYDKHHEIARRLLLGQKGVDIAKDMRCSAVSVSQIKNSPIVKDKLSLMSAARDVGCIDLAKEIQDLAPIALGKVREALEEGTAGGKELSGSEILKQANGIVDREIGKPTQRIESKNLHGHFTLDDIEEIKAKARELRADNV